MQANAFKTAYHEEITRAALPFVKPWILDAIIQSNHDSDSLFHGRAGKDRYHFNDCGFEAGSREIREQYKTLLSALTKAQQAAGPCTSTADRCAADLLDAAGALGIILHALQDFYAHSNWVESGANVIVDDVFSASDDSVVQDGFPILIPWKPQGDYVLLGPIETPISAKFKIARGARHGLVVVEEDNRRLIGIMTGAYNGEDEPCQGMKPCAQSRMVNACPESVAIGHWDDDTHGEGLHKDTPSRPYFSAARHLAFLQTRRQWCRLHRRMQTDGLNDVLAMIVDSPVESANACVPDAVLPAPPAGRTYWTWSPRATLGLVTGAGPGNQLATGIDYGGRIEVRYGAVGFFGGYRGEARGGKNQDWASLGIIVAKPSLAGGPFGALRWDGAWGRHRVGIDVGNDLRLVPWMPIFSALRIEIGVGMRIDDNGVRPDFRLGIAGGLSVDTPY